MVFKFTQLIRNVIKMAMFTMNIETGNLLEAKEGRFDTFDSWGLELEFRRRGCFEHWDKNIARIANAVQVTICLLVSTSVY